MSAHDTTLEDEIRAAALDAIDYRCVTHGETLADAAAHVEAKLLEQGIDVVITVNGR